MARRKEPHIPDAILDQLLSGADAKTAFDQGGLLDALKKALAERVLNAEMDHHLAGDGGAANSRNGYGRKSVVTDTGRIALDVPRDRLASFDPQLIAKYKRRFPGFDDKVISMYARGMSRRAACAAFISRSCARVVRLVMSVPFNEEVPGWMGDAGGRTGDAGGRTGAGIGMGVALMGRAPDRRPRAGR